MKKYIKKFVFKLLVLLARIRLKRLRLFVVGVTGSIGKTSTKDAIFSILETRYQTFKSKKNYNTEFGLPLSILEQQTGFSSPVKWLKTLIGSLWNAFFGGRHLQMLVLEMGVDKPGDMADLLKVVTPQISVMTNIKAVHLGEGQFKDLDDIFLEKRKLVDALPEKGTAILNADDPYVVSLKDGPECKKFLYGFSDIADLQVLDVKNSFDGITFTVRYKEEVISSSMPLLGSFQIYILLPALAVALTQGFNLQESIDFLKNYRLPPGRMNPIPGIKDTLIIDSSYNASPGAVKEALNILSESPNRKIAVLGNMNELGDVTESKHREIGKYATNHVDILVTIGDNAKFIHDEAINSGLPSDSACHFGDAVAASDYLRKIMQNHDTILVKGSQNKVRLERLVKRLMKEPERASELLVRQDSHWKDN